MPNHTDSSVEMLIKHDHDDHGPMLTFVQFMLSKLKFDINAICNKPRTAKVGAISKAQNLKGGPFGLCETPAGCKNFEKK